MSSPILSGRFTDLLISREAFYEIRKDLKPPHTISGQTWAMTILRLILHSKELEEGKDVPFNDFFNKMPFMESEFADGTMGADQFRNLEPPRYMKTHLPFQLWKKQLEKHPDLKVIQTLRNPKDTLVSYYHHMINDGHMGGFRGTWDQYFEEFKRKRLPWGDYFEHIADWYKFNEKREKSLVLRYEEMKENTKEHIIQIAQFVGHELSEKAVDLVAEKSSVKAVSKKFESRFKEIPMWKQDGAFIRKGEVGDWVNYFSEEQSEYVDEQCKEYLEPLGIRY